MFAHLVTFAFWNKTERTFLMDDFAVLVGVLATGSITINIYLIKSIANLCERLARLEGKLSRK